MKKTLFLFVVACALLVWSCSKEEAPDQLPQVSDVATESTVDRDCGCSYRVNSVPISFVNQHNEYNFQRRFSPYLNAWISGCQPGSINIGQWYPITLAQNVQYSLSYHFLNTCTTLGVGTTSVSIRCGLSTPLTVSMTSSGTTIPTTIGFYKSGCNVLQGWIE